MGNIFGNGKNNESDKGARLLSHWPILITALFIAFLVVWPTIFSVSKIGWQNWRGIYPVFNEDEIYYLAMTREVADGHLGLGNAFIAEHKNEPFLQPPLAEWFFAGLSKISGISVPGVFAVSDFALTFIIVFVIYWLFYNVARSRRVAFCLSAFFCLVFLNAFGRPINPQFSFVWLVLGLIIIWRIAGDENNLKVILKNNSLLVLFFGILLYVYLYYWTALIVVYGLVLLFKVRDWGWAASFKSAAVFGLGAVVMGLPYLFNQIKALSNPFYGETSLRMGLLSIHWPGGFVNVALLVLALALLYLMKNRISRQQFSFSLALLLGGVALNWQNIITGKYLQFSSHYYQVTVLFVLLALAMFLAGFWRQVSLKEKKALIFLFGVLLILAFIFYRQANEIKAAFHSLRGGSLENMFKYQQMADVFDWLNKETARDSVVLSLSEEYSALLPIYTSNNLYSYGYAGCHLILDDEIEDRWVRQKFFLDNISADYIRDNQRVLWLNKFIDKYQNKKIRNQIIGWLTGRKIAEPVLLPDLYVDRVLAKYNEVKKENPETALKKYKIDYILLDTKAKQYTETEKKLNSYRFVKPVAKMGNNIIYKVN